MEMHLNRLPRDMDATVTEIKSPELLRCRLKSFGLVPGTAVRIRYRSPDGGVTALELKNTIVALRSSELKKIRVRIS